MGTPHRAGSPELSSTHHLKLSWSATCTKDVLSALIPSCRIVSSTATNPTHASTTSHPEAIRPRQGAVAAGPRTGEHPDRPPTATGAEFTTGRNAASGGIHRPQAAMGGQPKASPAPLLSAMGAAGLWRGAMPCCPRTRGHRPLPTSPRKCRRSRRDEVPPDLPEGAARRAAGDAVNLVPRPFHCRRWRRQDDAAAGTWRAGKCRLGFADAPRWPRNPRGWKTDASPSPGNWRPSITKIASSHGKATHCRLVRCWMTIGGGLWRIGSVDRYVLVLHRT
jgi:hypothetical protein